MGKLKGVRQLWQITACGGASSYAGARVVPARSAVEAARFLSEVLVPAFAQAGWELQRVLTDRGSEFQGEFDQACRDLGINHTRTKPPSRLDKRVRGATAGDDPPRARAGGVPAEVLQERPSTSDVPGWVPAVLRRGATPSRAPDAGTHPGGGVLKGGDSRISQGGLKCQQYYGTGHPREAKRLSDPSLELVVELEDCYPRGTVYMAVTTSLD